MDINPIYTDALPYIDITSPYFALRNLSLLPSSSAEFPIITGHFSPIAAAPIAILGSNAIVLCRQLLQGGGAKKRLDKSSRLRCQRLAVAGEVLELRARKLGGEKFSHRIAFLDGEGGMVGTIDYTFVEVDVEKETPKL